MTEDIGSDLSSQSLDQPMDMGGGRAKDSVLSELSTRLQRTIGFIAGMLESEDEYVAEHAGDLLWHSADGMVRAVIPLLPDNTRSRNIRFQAARTLGYLGGREAAEALIQAVDDDSNELQLREAAALYLGRTRDTAAVDRLIDLLHDENAPGELRLTAAYGLGELRNPRAVAALKAQLNEPDVRFLTERGRRELENLRALQSQGSATKAFNQLIENAERGRSLHHEIENALRD